MGFRIPILCLLCLALSSDAWAAKPQRSERNPSRPSRQSIRNDRPQLGRDAKRKPRHRQARRGNVVPPRIIRTNRPPIAAGAMNPRLTEDPAIQGVFGVGFHTFSDNRATVELDVRPLARMSQPL